jgi:hypothetical protein
MGRTYKDREKAGRPRVPEWARPKPTIPHKRKDKDYDPASSRDEMLEDLWEGDDDQAH